MIYICTEQTSLLSAYIYRLFKKSNNNHLTQLIMTQKEFEERTGKPVTAEVYANIEKVYMNTNLDKDAFCNAYKKAPQVLSELEKQTVLVRELFEERRMMANFLIEQAQKWSASDLREKAIRMIGEKEYLRRKLEKGYEFWDIDKKMLNEILLEK